MSAVYLFFPPLNLVSQSPIDRFDRSRRIGHPFKAAREGHVPPRCRPAAPRLRLHQRLLLYNTGRHTPLSLSDTYTHTYSTPQVLAPAATHTHAPYLTAPSSCRFLFLCFEVLSARERALSLSLSLRVERVRDSPPNQLPLPLYCFSV